MSTPIPSRQECLYVLEMVDSNLIDFSYTRPWAEQIMTEVDSIPTWLYDLANVTYGGDVRRALREYLVSGPCEALPDEVLKFHIACLWLRYERRELSWATFL